jgi:hypothetical protein
LAQLEHYQNEFVLHGGVMKIYKNLLKNTKSVLAGQSMIGEDALDIQSTKQHLEFRDKIETQRC